MVRALNTIHLPGLLVAVPVRAAVAMTGYMNNGKNYAHNGREIYADKNIVENHIDRLSVNDPHRGGRYASGSGCWVESQYHRPPPANHKLIKPGQVSILFDNHIMLIHKVYNLDGSLDEHGVSKKINQPETFGLSLDSSHIFHDFPLLVS
jgi:hypothetical protein